MFMEIARTVSKRSTCPRLNVGAVIVRNKRVISIGYNGSGPGEPHCVDDGCIMDGHGGCVRTIHAEVNAINHIPSGLFNENCELYVTHSPCSDCIEAIKNQSWICRVIYEIPYRKTQPLMRLRTMNIEVFQLTPSGYLISNGQVVEKES